MIIAELPINEKKRLEDLNSYNILDSSPESDFDELVELASCLCKCPISLITLVDSDRQWFKANKGMDVNHTSRNIAFCSHAILADNIMIVENAGKDIRFKDNPLVTGDVNIQFYAGAPIVSPEGFKLGTICVIDNYPKILTADEKNALLLLAKQVTRLIEIRKKNIIIRKRAEEIISLKSNAISNVIVNNHENTKALALNLHEDVAQEIASCLLYLKVAETETADRLLLIEKAEAQLQKTLEKTRNLSYTIMPMTAKWVSIENLISEYLEKVEDTFYFDIEFNCFGQNTSFPSNQTLLTIHILEKWLQILAEKSNNTSLSITVKIERCLELIMEDNAEIDNLTELENLILGSLLSEMAISQGGKIDFQIPQKGKNLVKITFPLLDLC